MRRKIEEFSHPPHGPAGELRRNHGPHGHIKPTFFFTFIAGGTAGARSEIKRGGYHDDRSQNVVKLDIEIVDEPAAGKKIDHQPEQVDGEWNQQTDPCGGVADHAIPEVGLVFAVVGDVRARLGSGKASGESAPCADRNDHGQPDPMATVGAVGI